MKITSDMIAADLRPYGSVMRLIFPPKPRRYKAMHTLRSLVKGVNIPGFDCSQQFIPAREGSPSIRVRIYRPQNNRSDIPGILYMHGGGYAMNIPESEHSWIKRILQNQDCVIVAPDYRLSTKAPFPAAVNDCYDTLLWMSKNCKTLGFRNDQIFSVGGSAGGGLAAAISLMARNLKDIKIAFQAPLYPMLDHRMQTASMKDNNGPAWNEAHNRLAWEMYLKGTELDDINEYASPSLNQDFSNLPPAVSFIGDLDPFLDETKEYFEQLKKAGIETRLMVCPGAFHGFEYANPEADVSKKAISFFLESLQFAAENYFTSS